MDDNEINRLAAMGSALRPEWPARSLRTFISNQLGHRTYGDVAVALAWVATRTKTDTPRLLLEAGAWWKAAGTDNTSAPRPPRASEACGVCGQTVSAHSNPWIGDHEFTPITKATKNRSSSGVDLVRQELAAVTWQKTHPETGGEVGTGAGEGATGQDTGTAWVTRSTDCPEAPAQAHLPATPEQTEAMEESA